jgi:hypothetical protein
LGGAYGWGRRTFSAEGAKVTVLKRPDSGERGRVKKQVVVRRQMGGKTGTPPGKLSSGRTLTMREGKSVGKSEFMRGVQIMRLVNEAKEVEECRVKKRMFLRDLRGTRPVFGPSDSLWLGKAVVGVEDGEVQRDSDEALRGVHMETLMGLFSQTLGSGKSAEKLKQYMGWGKKADPGWTMLNDGPSAASDFWKASEGALLLWTSKPEHASGAKFYVGKESGKEVFKVGETPVKVGGVAVSSDVEEQLSRDFARLFRRAHFKARDGKAKFVEGYGVRIFIPFEHEEVGRYVPTNEADRVVELFDKDKRMMKPWGAVVTELVEAAADCVVCRRPAKGHVDCSYAAVHAEALGRAKEGIAAWVSTADASVVMDCGDNEDREDDDEETEGDGESKED